MVEKREGFPSLEELVKYTLKERRREEERENLVVTVSSEKIPPGKEIHFLDEAYEELIEKIQKMMEERRIDRDSVMLIYFHRVGEYEGHFMMVSRLETSEGKVKRTEIILSEDISNPNIWTISVWKYSQQIEVDFYRRLPEEGKTQTNNGIIRRLLEDILNEKKVIYIIHYEKN